MSLVSKDLYTVRTYMALDKNFILASWLRGLYYGDSWFSLIPKNIFMEHYHRILERLLDNPGVVIQVACLKDDPEVILGYSVGRRVGEKNVLDWVFVKKVWRNIGVCKSLLPNPVHACSHLTKTGRAMKPDSVDFNPFI